MIPLAIWLALIGYTVLWTGKMNLGVTYQPQADGSIRPVDAAGQVARTYTLLDAITCAAPSGSPPGGQAPAQPGSGVSPPATPALRPAPVTLPQLQVPALSLPRIVGPGGIELPGGIVIPLPKPAPRKPPTGGGQKAVDEVASFIHNLLQPAVGGLSGLLGRPAATVR